MNANWCESVVINEKYYMDFSTSDLHGDRKINKVIHTHNMLELSIVKSGTGKYYIGDEVYDVQKNDIFIINNVEAHGIEMSEKESLTNMVIHFEPRLVWSGENDFDLRYLKIFFDRSNKFCHKLDNNNLATKKIQELFFEMEEEFLSKQPEFNLMVKVKLLNMLVLLLRHYNYVSDENTHEENKYEIKIINKVTDYVDNYYYKDIKLQELADMVHMNPTYFSTFFRKYNGLTLTEYIVRKRISRAIEYLKGTDKTILEISGLCGFNNSANFNKMFKKVTGMTPTQFR
ncbi:MAG: hypothetical protein CVU84_13615 [Firmicutes bacterium HGW-Firmicutes-1]|nr:MAG: hypothetical protein CVU84_13615 [Firmicutes bacterium HGW-Firmicutes-1]